jgi:hypothetical protein
VSERGRAGKAERALFERNARDARGEKEGHLHESDSRVRSLSDSTLQRRERERETGLYIDHRPRISPMA